MGNDLVNVSGMGPGSPAHGSHFSRQKCVPCGRLWPSPWLLAGVNPRLYGMSMHWPPAECQAQRACG